MTFTHAMGEQFSQGCLWPARVRYALDRIYPVTGRLSCSCEGSGKRRIFAIVHYVNQSLLKPVHDWSMRVLSHIPMDGTFNQYDPIHRLQTSKVLRHCSSFDQQSATDRFPLTFQKLLIEKLFNKECVEVWVESGLGTNVICWEDFSVSTILVSKKSRPRPVKNLFMGSSGNRVTLKKNVPAWNSSPLLFTNSTKCLKAASSKVGKDFWVPTSSPDKGGWSGKREHTW
ncbi:hypothetical protein Dimus_037186 [Dionaea muscipula]